MGNYIYIALLVYMIIEHYQAIPMHSKPYPLSASFHSFSSNLILLVLP